MDAVMMVNTMAEAKAQVCALLDGNTAQISMAMNDSMHDGEPAKFIVALAVILEPEGREVKVTSRIGYAVKYKDETAPKYVSADPVLPGMEETE